jgi:hypothetical protein
MPIRQLLLLAALVVVLFEARPTWARCTGDCSGNGDVAIDELMTAVNIALGQTPATPCPGACPSPPICIDYLLSAVSSALNGCAEIPTLSASTPADGATNVPSSAWIRLEFAADIDPTNLDGFELSCEDVGFTASATAIAPNVVVINPRDPLFDNCHVAWRGGSLSFSVAAAGAPATVLYDHEDTRRTSPFPDDAWTVADSSTRTGLRLAVPVPEGPMDLQQIFGGLLPEANRLDGFSPIAHFVIELSDAPDLSTLPLTPAASLDPLATVGLFDLNQDSATYGQRIPFRLEPRTDTSVEQVVAHSLLIFPSIPLTQRGRYGFVVTRRVLVDPSRPFDESEFLRNALTDPRVKAD